MKKLIFPAVAALALGLASCSSDEVNPGNGGGTVNYAEGGYVRLSINMPSTKGTRGVNDSFDDGLAKEYAVKNATLILFKEGTTSGEAAATFHSAYDLTPGLEMVGTSTDQITSTMKIVPQTDNTTPSGNSHQSGKLYALVVLNNNGLLAVNGTGLKVGGTDFTSTFSDFCTKVSKASSTVDRTNSNYQPGTGATMPGIKDYVPSPEFSSDVANKGIFMTNSPLAKVVTTGTTPTSYITLVDVSGSVYKTEKEAQNSPAADIYVERGVAKVTFDLANSGKNPNGEGTLSGAEFNKVDVNTGATVPTVKYKIIGWNLDVTNTSSYLVRHVDESLFGYKSRFTDKIRFVGTREITAQTGGGEVGATNPYTQKFVRTYWAKDPNYETDGNFNELRRTPQLSADFGNLNPQYCYENTFDVAHQNQDQTTRVVVAVKLTLNDGCTDHDAKENLYTFNNDRSKLLCEKKMYERVKTAIVHAMKDDSDCSDIVEGEIANADITFTDFNQLTQVQEVKSIQIKKNNEAAKKTFDENSTAVKVINKELGKIAKYTGGVAYYPIRIKHFGDEYTPWSTTQEGVKSGDNAATYPNVSATDSNAYRYLGRYGVVRNNWYDLSVSDIKGVGSPTIPELNGNPDDESYNYISVRINILSWAKRTQHEEL